MKTFFHELKRRNALLYYAGLGSATVAILLVLLMPFIDVKVLGIHALIKPIKFLLSTFIFCWTMGWLLHYLAQQKQVKIYSWVVLIVLLFENIYISWQALLGQLSHFNISTPFHDAMFGLMGLAIGIMTIWTAYMGSLFFRPLREAVPAAYLWGIRLGIFLFVLFAFEGYAMGAIQAHTVGAADGGEGLPFVNWSTRHGDLRIAHFLGMHALQILPLLGYFVFRRVSWIIVVAILYFSLVTAILFQAWQGLPLVST